MANNEQMNLLKQGTQAWNAWRAEQTEAAVDLSGAALRGLDLEGADLSGADLKDADLRGANLGGADLKGAHLDGANLRRVQVRQCPQLESARNWQSAYRDQDLACGAAIPSR